jgi:hypothetical protein
LQQGIALSPQYDVKISRSHIKHFRQNTEKINARFTSNQLKHFLMLRQDYGVVSVAVGAEKLSVLTA